MTDFSGVRILLVEDEGAVAMMVEDMLEELGCEIIASVADFAEASRCAESAEINLAMLDVNVAGQPIFPVAEVLRERQVPFFFSTGYGSGGLPAEFSDCPVLPKPFSKAQLEQKISLTLKL